MSASKDFKFGVSLLQIIVCNIFNPCDLLPCHFNIIVPFFINFGVSNLACFLVVSNRKEAKICIRGLVIDVVNPFIEKQSTWLIWLIILSNYNILP